MSGPGANPAVTPAEPCEAARRAAGRGGLLLVLGLGSGAAGWHDVVPAWLWMPGFALGMPLSIAWLHGALRLAARCGWSRWLARDVANRRSWHRLQWLLIGLAGWLGVVAAALIVVDGLRDGEVRNLLPFGGDRVRRDEALPLYLVNLAVFGACALGLPRPSWRALRHALRAAPPRPPD